jgi:4-hydroxy-3-polyprenylbenzoate decarboxylase
VTTVVGIPPMEDYYLGMASERIFPAAHPQDAAGNRRHALSGGRHLPQLRAGLDRQAIPGHARKIMNAFWGLGQLMFSKCIVVVDKDVNVQDEAEVAWIAGTHVDPSRDIQIVTGPVMTWTTQRCCRHSAARWAWTPRARGLQKGSIANGRNAS